MRIALTITELDPGGAEKCFVNLACFLAQQGHEVRVWQLGPPPRETALTDQLESLGIPHTSGGASSAWDFIRTMQWLRRELAEYNADLVQSFLFHANIVTRMALRRTATLHFGGVRVRQPQYLRQRIQRWASKRMHRLVCVSQSVAKHCQEVEKIAPDKLVVIPNGIRIPPSSESLPIKPTADLGLTPDDAVILFVGRLDEQKRVTELVSQSEATLAKFPNHHLVLVGEGNLRPEIERLRDASQYSERIHLLGWQPDPLGWMRRAELLVLPALYEGMPNVVLEAMAVGLPTVCFNVDGVSEALGSSDLSQLQLVHPGDFTEFFSKVEAFAQSAERRTACGAHNRARVETYFQLDGQLQQYEQLYLEAVKEASES